MSLRPSNLQCLPMVLPRSLWLAIPLVRHTSHVVLPYHAELDTGSAITLLDSVYLPLWLPGTTFQTIGYGLPRVR